MYIMFVLLPQKSPTVDDVPRCENTMVALSNVCNENAFNILSGKYRSIQHSWC